MPHSPNPPPRPAKPIKVVSVEDNPLVGEAIGRKLKGNPDFEWLGWVDNAQALYDIAQNSAPDIVCMDLDMPGQDAFEMIRELQNVSPHSRVLILSGHVNADFIDQAVNAGAWGYLSKAEDSRIIVDTFRQIAAGNFVIGRLNDYSRRPVPETRRASEPAQSPQPPAEARESGLGSVWTFMKRFATRQRDS
jgi:DNA-binding NarL/FixJ family response regulator